ncbi:MAG: hypothetical protein IH857_02795 [Deltaproteobacteria bacterium]|nr:hypothetical protein [Deltaproteobacteria bacterium]MCZ6624989.1 hypothetical protein [Deltaproteobacteria bacterium]
MNQNVAYNQSLRAIGQVLEAQQLSTFDLTYSAGYYLVRGEPERGTVLRALLQKWQSRYHKHKAPFEQSYTPRDIDLLERQGQAKRHNQPKLPDFYSLPNILRAVGAYIDMKGAHLLKVNKRDLTVMILYQTSQGHPRVEERSIASFYKLFLEMYQKRHKKEPI